MAGDPQWAPSTMICMHWLGKRAMMISYPITSRGLVMCGLAGFCDLITGLQSVRGKILSSSGSAELGVIWLLAICLVCCIAESYARVGEHVRCGNRQVVEGNGIELGERGKPRQGESCGIPCLAKEARHGAPACIPAGSGRKWRPWILIDYS